CGAARRRRVRAPGRREGVAVRAQRRGRRAAAHALRAGRVARPERVARAAGEPGQTALPPSGQPGQPAQSEVFPIVLTSSRLTEHYTSGAMTRTLPFLA